MGPAWPAALPGSSVPCRCLVRVVNTSCKTTLVASRATSFSQRERAQSSSTGLDSDFETITSEAKVVEWVCRVGLLPSRMGCAFPFPFGDSAGPTNRKDGRLNLLG